MIRRNEKANCVMKRENDKLDEQFQSAFNSRIKAVKNGEEVTGIYNSSNCAIISSYDGEFIETEDSESYIDKRTSIECEEWYYLTHDHYVFFYS